MSDQARDAEASAPFPVAAPRSLDVRRRAPSGWGRLLRGQGRRAAALASFGLLFALSAGGCSRQAEGERCDYNANGDDDCEDGLLCTPKVGADRCCPPSGAPIDDSRCLAADAPSGGPSGGTSSGGSSTGGSTTAGSSSGGIESGGTSGGTTGGEMATGGTPAGGTSGGEGGEEPTETAGSGGQSESAAAGSGGEP